jgi:hypothetical protein
MKKKAVDVIITSLHDYSGHKSEDHNFTNVKKNNLFPYFFGEFNIIVTRTFLLIQYILGLQYLKLSKRITLIDYQSKIIGYNQK